MVITFLLLLFAICVFLFNLLKLFHHVLIIFLQQLHIHVCIILQVNIIINDLLQLLWTVHFKTPLYYNTSFYVICVKSPYSFLYSICKYTSIFSSA